ncbi:MAG TPA: sigma-54 dependent transcriptional regulator [Planctomycetota bacterium]|jgi:two-component system response regulator HydG|nr:sigma-54 dependent transcriptional regulator [Planctomycetota bacterium]
MTTLGRILAVEDDEAMRMFLEEELRDAGYDVVTATNGIAALHLFNPSTIDVVVSDVIMPGMRGDELLAELHARHRDVPVVLITAFGTIDSAVGAIKAGAYHYVAKPFHMPQLLSTLEEAMQDRRLVRRLDELRARLDQGTQTIVTEADSMRECLDLALKAAASQSHVLLLGESGTGKELIARMIHEQSGRSERPFVPVNCSAIPESLLESHLFGHRRGAFTDAREDRAGLFQEATGGTIFLDEIGDMPLPLQAKILRVLQEREIHPLGAPMPIPVDVRVVAATHRDLDAQVAAGAFRQDLYYRLHVLVIRVPPLRERPDDVLPLAAHFLAKHGKRHGRTGCTLTPEALHLLVRHNWPGNVRELENTIERCIVLGRNEEIDASDLPDTLGAHSAPLPEADEKRSMAEVEREHILRVLRTTDGNKAAAARMLGLDRKTLYRKLAAWESHALE